MTDPISTGSNERFSLFPIEHPDTWDLYKRAEASFWTAEEVDLVTDVQHWDRLKESEQHFVKMVLAFFAQSDGIVMENLAARFLVDTQIPEARSFYAFQIAMENIHAETYALMIDVLIKDSDEKRLLFKAIDNFPCVRKKADWALKWLASDRPFAERLVAFAAVEGIFFSGSFCAIFWLKKRGLMPGLSFANQLISRDEGCHTDFAVHMYKKEPPVDADTVLEIVRDAVSIESEFTAEALPVSLIGMNCDHMCEYIRFIADRLLVDLGVGKDWNVVNPFPFMEQISLQGRTNFFETRNDSYQLSNVMAGADRTFELDVDF